MRYPSEPIYDGVAASHRTSNVRVVSMAFNNVRYNTLKADCGRRANTTASPSAGAPTPSRRTASRDQHAQEHQAENRRERIAAHLPAPRVRQSAKQPNKLSGCGCTAKGHTCTSAKPCLSLVAASLHPIVLGYVQPLARSLRESQSILHPPRGISAARGSRQPARHPQSQSTVPRVCAHMSDRWEDDRSWCRRCECCP